MRRNRVLLLLCILTLANVLVAAVANASAYSGSESGYRLTLVAPPGFSDVSAEDTCKMTFMVNPAISGFLRAEGNYKLGLNIYTSGVSGGYIEDGFELYLVPEQAFISYSYRITANDPAAPAPPTITSFAPPSPVSDTVCNWRTFSVTVNQTVNLNWHLNDSLLFTNESVTEANYTLHAEVPGEHTVSAAATNLNGTDMQTWIWNVLAPDIAVDPTILSFGDVEIGQSSSLIATISNYGDYSLELTCSQTGSTDFSYILATATVDPGNHADLTVTYSPPEEGKDEGIITIGSNDPDEPSIELTLTGNGILVVHPPEQLFQEWIDVYNENIDSSNLTGIGSGQSADNREHAIRNMLDAANDLYADGLIDEACGQLHALYAKIDGEPRPPDFIGGEPAAVEELRQKTQELMEALGCDMP